MRLLNAVKTYGRVHLTSFSRSSSCVQYSRPTSHYLAHTIHHPSIPQTVPLKPFQTLSRRWQSSTTDDSKTSKGQSKSQPNDTEDDGNLSKKTRSGGRKTSLHRVAIEAQRSRDRLVLRSKGLRFVNPDADTKLVTAYSAAEQYNIYKVADYLRRGHFKVDPYQTGLFPQVVHIQTLGDGFLTYATQQSQNQNETLGDVFIFPSGTMVTWNVPIKTAQYLLELIEPAAKEPHRATMETEDLDFVEDPFQRQSRVIGDTIILGTKVDASNDIIESTHRHAGKEDEATTEDQRPTIDIALAKVAFSSGFARSTRLAVLESRLDSLVESTRQIPDLLSTMTRFRRPKRFSRQFVLQKTGELLSLRAQLNLYSELTDSLPDIFWDSRHELGLEGYYDMVGKALDVGQRIKVLNERMDYAQEITTVLRETLNEKHGEFLEWLVILLIFIEVLFELPRFIDDRWPRHSDKTDDSVMRYLEQGLAKK